MLIFSNEGKHDKMTKQNRKPQPVKSKTREWVETFVWALGIALVIRTLLIQAFTIPTPSMENTLLVGDFLFVNKIAYGPKIPFTDLRIPGIRKPERGDIIVFRVPFKAPWNKRDYIKRCVAIPGDTLEVKDKQLFINGELQTAPPNSIIDMNEIIPDNALDPRTFKRLGNRDNYGPLVIPEKSYFMMGDNRDNSSDSRFWGFVPEGNIHGKAAFIYFSWDKRIPIYNLIKRIRWSRIGDLIK
jgi:signal peptidase I